MVTASGEEIGDDVIIPNTIENVIAGTGNDLVIGDGNANVLNGNSGDDTIDGGGGSDTAVFSGNSADYILTDLGGGIFEMGDDNAGDGDDGTDTLTNIEFLQFADQTVSIDDFGGEGPFFVIDSFSAGGQQIAVAIDPTSGYLFSYNSFNTVINEITQGGAFVSSIPRPGVSANDFGLDFIPEPVNVGDTTVAPNTLLAFDGDNFPDAVFAINNATGVVISSQILPIDANLVGGTYHAARDTIFTVDFTGTDLIREINPANGAELNSFPASPGGAPAFDVFFGGIDVIEASGNLLVVSDSQPVIRELTPDGVFVQDFDVSGLGISGMSGISVDDASDEFYITNTIGAIFRLGGLDDGEVPPPPPGNFLGPIPYLSVADSPFDLEGSAFVVEDFEDGVFNVPGVVASAGAPIGPGGTTDSVDADDGAIDGLGNDGNSFFSINGAAGITFTFDTDVLGALPTSAGIVWTDGSGTTTFEAFGPGLVSLGTISANVGQCPG